MPLYIPAGRNVSVSYTDEFLELFRELAKVKMTAARHPDGSLRRQDAEEVDLVLLRDFILYSAHLRQEYRDMGITGMLQNIKDASIRVEEPEAHLFPSGQHRVMELLAALVNTGATADGIGNQVVMTTHSPYLLTILNNLVFAGDLADALDANATLKGEIPPIFRLKPHQVSAYMLDAEGRSISIKDEETGFVHGTSLENYWNRLQNQFDTLMEVEE